MSRLIFTAHAVERFVQRHAPEMTISEAKAFLETKGQAASRLKARTILGQAQFQLDNPRCIFVTTFLENGDYICKTILPYRASKFDVSLEELAIREEHAAEASEREARAKKASLEWAAGLKSTPRPSPVPVSKPVPLSKKSAAAPKKISPALIEEAIGSLTPYRAERVLRAAQHAELETEMIKRASMRDAEKTKRHNEGQEIYVRSVKNVLRSIVPYLINRSSKEDSEAFALLEQIQGIDPGLLTLEFIHPGMTATPSPGDRSSEPNPAPKP